MNRSVASSAVLPRYQPCTRTCVLAETKIRHLELRIIQLERQVERMQQQQQQQQQQQSLRDWSPPPTYDELFGGTEGGDLEFCCCTSFKSFCRFLSIKIFHIFL